MAARRSVNRSNGVPVAAMPGAIWSRIASGSSYRGLSEVSTHRSEWVPAMVPISARLVVSRSPPQPKTVMTRPSAKPRIVVRTLLRESGEWA
ncbi:hypothetical protein SCYAM73S_02997 [Streptomyces cyaneofuscatus]